MTVKVQSLTFITRILFTPPPPPSHRPPPIQVPILPPHPPTHPIKSYLEYTLLHRTEIGNNRNARGVSHFSSFSSSWLLPRFHFSRTDSRVSASKKAHVLQEDARTQTQIINGALHGRHVKRIRWGGGLK